MVFVVVPITATLPVPPPTLIWPVLDPPTKTLPPAFRLTCPVLPPPTLTEAPGPALVTLPLLEPPTQADQEGKDDAGIHQ